MSAAAAIYARVSTVQREAGGYLSTQIETCLKLAAENRLEIEQRWGR